MLNLKDPKKSHHFLLSFPRKRESSSAVFPLRPSGYGGQAAARKDLYHAHGALLDPRFHGDDKKRRLCLA